MPGCRVFPYATEAGKQRAYTKLPGQNDLIATRIGPHGNTDEVEAALVSSFEQD